MMRFFCSVVCANIYVDIWESNDIAVEKFWNISRTLLPRRDREMGCIETTIYHALGIVARW